MITDNTPTILVIVGITGDLAHRKLLPAIERLVASGSVPKNLRIVGITRRDVTAGEVIAKIDGDSTHDFFIKNLEMFKMDLGAAADYEKLKDRLQVISETFDSPAQCLFYLSVPPQISGSIVQLLGESGFAKMPGSKLLMEKPFGTDLASAQLLIQQTKQFFDESQIYRIDHYLAKEMAQNIIVFREGNALFKRTWNKDFIDSIEIVASEKLGIEGRAAFYEQTGALRDLVQSHLLQLAALTLMETPKAGQLEEVPSRRLAALTQLNISDQRRTRRGQYNGYRQEVDNEKSLSETYVDVTLESTDPNWQGVPIRIVTGKSLAYKQTEIKIIYRRDEDYQSNELIITLQPNEGFTMNIWTKVSGYDKRVQQHALHHTLQEQSTVPTEAYEQVFHDAIYSDHTLFASSDEILETWRIIDPIQKDWASDGAEELFQYAPGTDVNAI